MGVMVAVRLSDCHFTGRHRGEGELELVTDRDLDV